MLARDTLLADVVGGIAAADITEDDGHVLDARRILVHMRRVLDEPA